MALPAVGVFIFGLLVLGLMIEDPRVERMTNRALEAPTAEPLAGGLPVPTSNPTPLPHAPSGSAFSQAVGQYGFLFHTLFNLPDVCLTGDAVNTLQVERCQRIWTRLGISAGLCSVPAGLAVVFLMLALDSLVATYRKMNRLIRDGRATYTGVVTDPPQAPPDRFAKVYGFRKIRVQLGPMGQGGQGGQGGKERQVNVYFSGDANWPLPGARVAIFDAGKLWGKRRYISVIYSPHVAVISG